VGNDLFKICHAAKITLFRILEEPNRLEMFVPLFRLLQAVFELFFPLLCINCQKEINSRQKILCLYCELELPLTYLNLIHPSPLKRLLFNDLKIDRVFSLYIFEEMALIESLLYQLKYVGNKAIGVFFDQKLAGLISGLACTFDGIIGVPHPKRQRKRGFNQVDLIGQSAAKALSITYYGTFLERIKHTPKLSKASRDRTEILQDAFRINPLIKLPKGHYLLLDDILTTGVTLKACSKLLVKIDHLSLSIATIVYRN
jgi:competence protein ComFC